MTICTWEICLLDGFHGFSHIDRLITQDETWVHHYDPETKAQSKQVVVMDILAKGTKINEAYFASLLTKLRNSIKTERRSTPAG